MPQAVCWFRWIDGTSNRICEARNQPEGVSPRFFSGTETPNRGLTPAG